MLCKSCKNDVPPKFAHAFTVNICPLCGGEIMPLKLKNILGELKVALGDAKEYMDEVEDWLFSNFGLKKIKPNEVVVDKNQLKAPRPETVETHSHAHNPGTMVNRRDDDEQSEDVVIDEKPSTVFAKRAGVIHPKSALDFIKGRTSVGAADPSEFQGVDEEYGDMSLGDEGLNPLSSTERHQMGNIFKGVDLSDTSHELELQKLKKLQAQSAVAGGGGGFFRRT